MFGTRFKCCYFTDFLISQHKDIVSRSLTSLDKSVCVELEDCVRISEFCFLSQSIKLQTTWILNPSQNNGLGCWSLDGKEIMEKRKIVGNILQKFTAWRWISLGGKQRQTLMRCGTTGYSLTAMKLSLYGIILEGPRTRLLSARWTFSGAPVCINGLYGNNKQYSGNVITRNMFGRKVHSWTKRKQFISLTALRHFPTWKDVLKN